MSHIFRKWMDTDVIMHAKYISQGHALRMLFQVSTI